MVGRIRFGSRELFDILTDVSKRLDDEVEAYLIGGLAMMQHGLKVTTKDVAVVFKDEVDEQTFEDALRACGFYGVTNIPREYRELGAMIIMEVPGGMRFDIFVETVCRKLRLTEGMRGRAEALDLDGRLRLMVSAPEDIFLFKSVTDRDDDLADMALLAGRGLNWTSMYYELREDRHNLMYLPHFAVKLEALEEGHGIVAPGRPQLLREAEVIVGMNRISEQFHQKSISLTDAARVLGEGEIFAQSVLDKMVDLDFAIKDDDDIYNIVKR